MNCVISRDRRETSPESICGSRHDYENLAEFGCEVKVLQKLLTGTVDISMIPLIDFWVIVGNSQKGMKMGDF
jgi:hypothetical protein